MQGPRIFRYVESLQDALKVTDLSFRQVALLNYVREELVAGQELPASLLDQIRDMKIDPNASTLEIFKQKVVALIDQSSQLGTAERGKPPQTT